MKKFFLVFCFTGLSHAQLVDSAPRKIANGPSTPATCSVGQVFFKTGVTAGTNWHLCTSTDTWTQVQGGGGGTGAFADITGAPTDNTALATALGAKAASNATSTVNGVSCALGSTCTVSDSTKEPADANIVKSSGSRTSNAVMVYNSSGLLISTGCTISTGPVLDCGASDISHSLSLPEKSSNGTDSFTIYGKDSQAASVCIIMPDAAPTSGQRLSASASTAVTSDGNTCRIMEWKNTFNTNVCEIVVGDPGAGSPVLANDNDSPAVCSNKSGLSYTITLVECYADAGSPTVTPILTGGSATSILSGALTCGTGSFAASTALSVTQSNGASIDANITSAGGTAKYIVFRITRTF